MERTSSVPVATTMRHSRDFKVREGLLSAESINKTITAWARSWPWPRSAI